GPPVPSVKDHGLPCALPSATVAAVDAQAAPERVATPTSPRQKAPARCTSRRLTPGFAEVIDLQTITDLSRLVWRRA
ncbi:MAG TPA: hypothetical protein VIM14_07400, partial [Polyangia bacterium]